MKRKLSVLIIVGLSTFLMACEDDHPAPEVQKTAHVTQSGDVKPVMMIAKTGLVPVKKAEELVVATPEYPSVDTSVFEYARSVEVIDARELNRHLTLIVRMSADLTQGLAANHVLTQTYEFIQQEDVVGADTITIGVMSGDTRVFQFTVKVADFVADHDAGMRDQVLAASNVDKISLDVQEFAEAFEWRMNR